MSAKNTNRVMGAKGRYLEAQRRADAKDAARTAKKDRAAKRAALRPQASTPTQPSSLPSVQPDQTDVLASVLATAAQEAKQETQAKLQYCICHGDRPVAYHTLCQQSIDSLRFTRPPKLPSDVVGVRRERAELIAWKVRPARTKYELTQAKMSDPDVANFVAANVIKKGMDYTEGVADALPELKDKPAELGPAINAAKQSPVVQAAINETLKKRGLDGDSKAYYTQKLWEWFESRQPSEERKTLQAARLLGEAFLKNQTPTGEVATLRVEGIESGLRQMFGDDYEKVKNLKPVSTDVPVEEFEEDDSEIGED